MKLLEIGGLYRLVFNTRRGGEDYDVFMVTSGACTCQKNTEVHQHFVYVCGGGTFDDNELRELSRCLFDATFTVRPKSRRLLRAERI